LVSQKFYQVEQISVDISLGMTLYFSTIVVL